MNESGGISSSSTFLSSDGEGYERQMGRWSRRLAPLFVEFAGINAARHILDVGCGTGSLAFCLARRPGISQVTGVDRSPVYVAYAKRKYPDARMAFQVGDACDLPFDDASFDHTLSMLVLQFIPQAERAVREMRRVTRRGGVVAAATWDTGGGLLAHRMIFDSAALIDPGGNAARARDPPSLGGRTGLPRRRRRWATLVYGDGLGREGQSHVKGRSGTLGVEQTSLTSAIGPKLRLRVGQSMSALPGYFRRQIVPLWPGRHLLRCPDI